MSQAGSSHSSALSPRDREVFEAIVDASSTPYGQRDFKTNEIARRLDKEGNTLSPTMRKFVDRGYLKIINNSNAGYVWRADLDAIKEVLKR